MMIVLFFCYQFRNSKLAIGRRDKEADEMKNVASKVRLKAKMDM
jgi:hypothetical protein